MSHVIVSAPPIDDPACDPLHRVEASDVLVSYLAQIGVEHVFGVPGGAIEPLYNALARSARQGGPRAVVARHETGAAFMADGYARETGGLGVCCATTGPGATNLLTGVASAYQNNIPLLVITAQTALPTFGKGAFQESSCTGINTLAIFECCTGYNSLVSHPEQFESKLIAAIMTAWRSRTTAHLSVPLDILRGPAPLGRVSSDLTKLLSPSNLFDASAAPLLDRYLQAARNPVLLVGGGCVEAMDTILEYALRIDAPVVTTPHGKGLVNAFHPQYHGVFGFAGHRNAYALLADPSTDLILAVGTQLGEWDSCGWDEKAILNNRLIQIDATDAYFSRAPMARLQVQGRILAVFEYLLQQCRANPPVSLKTPVAAQKSCARFPQGARIAHADTGAPHPYRPYQITLDDEAKCHDDSVPLKPQRLMRELSHRFPFSTRFLADTGNSFAWAIHYLHPFDRRQSGRRPASAGIFRTAMEFASMGWAIGAAIGTALAGRERPVVCIVGDGSFLMSGQELTVAVQEKLTVIFVILNDSALGMVKHGQRLAGAEPVGFELPAVDYSAMARAMGAQAYTIRTPDDLVQLDIDELCRYPGPTLLDIQIDKEETPPIHARVNVLRMPRIEATTGATEGSRR